MIFMDVEFSGEDSGIKNLEGGQQLQKFIKSLGIEFVDQTLANDRQFVRSTRRSVDHYFLFTNNFSSHEAMSNITRQDEKMGLLTFQSGYLAPVESLSNQFR